MNAVTKNNWDQTKLHFISLLIFASIFLFTGIGNVQLVDWDENIYAEASRQMMIRGDYLNVHVNNQLFAEKPPFYFWEQVVSYRLFGVNEFAARFPSGIAGILLIVLFFHVGSNIGSPKLGLIWGVIYLTSFLPSVFGRVAVIDHTFNLFIAGAAYFLYLFDNAFRESLQTKGVSLNRPSRRTHLLYLTFASIFMGLAVLTKGPLGGVIPLVAFTGYKLFHRQPRIHILHFLFCAATSLMIALSWYAANWLKTGESFLAGFIKFQLLLFSKPMEGHEGPFFYHFVVAVFGLLPWTVFLFSSRFRHVKRVNQHFAPLYQFGLAWIGFVLILFSLVSTKLPHYSASIYIPLSMMVAFSIYSSMDSETGLPKWSIWLTGGLGLGLAIVFISMPIMLSAYAKVQQVAMPIVSSLSVAMVGLLIACCFLAATICFLRRKTAGGLIATALAMLIFTQGFWRLQLPTFIDIHQKPLLEVVEEAHSNSERVVFYRMVSFAAFFYGEKPIEVLHNYKFSGNPDILNHRHQEDLYIICDIKNAARLQKDHPLVERIRQVGRFCLYKIVKEADAG